MYIEKSIPHRQKDEKLILFLRRHPIALAGRWAFLLILIIIPIGVYYYLVANFSDILALAAPSAFLVLLGSIYYLFVMLFFLNTFIDYFLDVWIVTDQRIINIEQRGLFNREIAEHDLDKIQDVSGIQKGFWQTFFSYGDVHVQTAGEIQRFVFRQVDNPFDVVRVLNNLIQKHEKEFDDKVFAEIKEKKQGAE
ncbi:MAG: PH domain-containing protein [Candidatus Parcubacteria bacterium]|nr:PH domain-containing protein [Candidatus Parcubacteria bacterium]